MQRLVPLSALAMLLACAPGTSPRPSRGGPGIVFPTTLGEGHQEPESKQQPPPTAAAAPSSSSSASPDASAAAPAPPPGPQGGPPDPEPLRLAEQWEYDLEMNAGQIAVLSAQPKRFAQPVVSARRFGRYAIELWIGRELIERVRFDFPGLALEEPAPTGPRRRIYEKPDLSRGAKVRQKVLVPASPRALRAVLVDRATSATIPLPWPPDQPLPAPSAASSAPPDANRAPAKSGSPSP